MLRSLLPRLTDVSNVDTGIRKLQKRFRIFQNLVSEKNGSIKEKVSIDLMRKEFECYIIERVLTTLERSNRRAARPAASRRPAPGKARREGFSNQSTLKCAES